MDRPIIYPLQVPASEQLLYGWQRQMVALSKLASIVLGPSPTGSWINGFAVTPAGGLQVQVAPGQVYQQTAVDNTSYGALPPDHNQILRQFLQDSLTTITIPNDTSSGQTQTSLIQFIPQTQNTGAQVLQYFDPANPDVAFGGPGNSGESQATVRSDTVVVQLVSSTPGGSAPPLSNGAVAGVWVTVSYGQNTITQSDITQASGGSPYVTLKLPYAAGQQISNTFTQTQMFDQDIFVQGTVYAEGEVSAKYLFSPLTGSYLYNLGTGDVSSDVVLRSDGANVHMYPWGVPYGQLMFGAYGGYNVTFNGQVSASSLYISGGGSFGAPVTGPFATADNEYVPLGQLSSHVSSAVSAAAPPLFSSANNYVASRSLGTPYTNSTGKPMMVCVTVNSVAPAGNLFLFANGQIVAENHNDPQAGGILIGCTGIIPAGATYYAAMDNQTPNLYSWTEVY